MNGKAFVYTELHLSTPFDASVWAASNPLLLDQPGLCNKTWLAGLDNQSVGGFYEFESVAHALAFVTGYFPQRAARRGVAQTTRVFDGSVVEDASRDLNSMHFGGRLGPEPEAFVYTEAQISAPFATAPWRDMNPVLKAQPGLLHKTWLSGLNTHSVGGFYAFDHADNARRFVTDDFPTEMKALGVAYTTRLFDATIVRDASRPMKSPFVR